MGMPGSRALVGDFGAGQALSDEQYHLVEPLIPPAKPSGRPRSTDMRRVLDGLSYLVRTGCQWRHLPPPSAFPPWQTVNRYMRAFACGRVGGDALPVRDDAARAGGPRAQPDGGAAIIDTQGVKTTEKGGPAATMPPRGG